MLDLIVGIAILAFILLGLREGLVKAFAGVAAVFAALFLASGALEFFSKEAPRFNDPKALGAVILFVLIWAVSYVLLEILLSILFGRIVKVTVLGSLDRFGGVLAGGFKGLLICGIIFELAAGLPVSDSSKKLIKGSRLADFSKKVYNWSYPLARRAAPQVKSFLEREVASKITRPAEIKPGRVMQGLEQNVENYKSAARKQEEAIMKLLKEQKLLNDTPLRGVESVR